MRTPLHYAMGVENVEKLAGLLITAGAQRILKDLVRIQSQTLIYSLLVSQIQWDEYDLPFPERAPAKLLLHEQNGHPEVAGGRGRPQSVKEKIVFYILYKVCDVLFKSYFS